MNKVTVVIPTHPARMASGRLDQALASVWAQTLQPDSVIIQVDSNKEGACETRNKGLAKVNTEWVAFLDSDDRLLPDHLEKLVTCAEETQSDLVYPWFIPEGRSDPLSGFRKPFDPDRLRRANYIPVTVLARTEAVQSVGGFEIKIPSNPCEDWGCWLRMLDAGCKFTHLPEKTWIWSFHAGHTTGRPDLGDARG